MPVRRTRVRPKKGTAKKATAKKRIAKKTIVGVHARRERLRSRMDRLEHALAAPVPRGKAAWLARVRAALRDLAAAVTDHVAEVEATDGVFAQVQADAPQLARKIAQLKREHAEVTETMHALGERLRSERAATPDAVREDLLGLLGQLVRHRQLGADLLYDAYVLDVSGGD
jgi:hypothetical protein